ncbi:hypothetical protein [Vulgatibacter sp.]|uniref:hypothetical protein n=1 Tax=Vulgatibacter sp. TaxID=1971226 RepID=UPI0035627F99
MRQVIAAVALASFLAPGVASAQDGYPRLVEKDGQVCLQELDSYGVVEERCQAKPSSPAAVDLGIRPALASPNPAPIDAAESLSWASVKYSWSAAFKWSAITSGVAGTALLVDGISDDGSDSSTAGWLFVGSAALSLVLALVIDGSAADDVADARRVLAR